MTIHSQNPMMPEWTHREMSEQAFVVDLKKYIAGEIDPMCRELASATHDNLASEDASTKLDAHVCVRRKLSEDGPYGAWVNLAKATQDMMWESVAIPIDRQIDSLVNKAQIDAPKGSLTLDPDFVAPAYLRAQDVHRMPGNYVGVFRDNDVRQGAMYDCGGYIYNMGGKNGQLNDVRGHTLVSHYFSRFADRTPERILEMGCSAGNSTVAIARYFPDAQMHAIDVGEGLLRYAFARAEHMGASVHFSQQDAASTNFEDNSFDLVCSCVMLHETSTSAAREIFEESFRVLKPGGVVVHLEVPSRYQDLDVWSRIRADYESHVNNEPFWRGALELDFDAIAEKIGFKDRQSVFQDATRRAERSGGVMRDTSLGVHRSWFVFSAVKPTSA